VGEAAGHDMLDKNKAEKIVKFNRAGRIRRFYIFVCSYVDCLERIKVRSDGLKTASGMCLVHSHVKRPFEGIYNKLLRDWRKPDIDLTYEQFLNFTKIGNCHYCGDKITRVPYSTVKGRFKSSAYFLDKKNPAGSYSKLNCVVCCT
jgi:hypothetical protein